MDNTIAVSPIPTLRIHKDHPKGQILGDPTSAVQEKFIKLFSSTSLWFVDPAHPNKDLYGDQSTYSPYIKLLEHDLITKGCDVTGLTLSGSIEMFNSVAPCATTDQGEGSAQPAEPYHTPVDPLPSTSLPHQSPPHSPCQSPPHSPFQSPPYSSPHSSPPRSYEAPLPEGKQFLEKELQNTKYLRGMLCFNFATLRLRTKKGQEEAGLEEAIRLQAQMDEEVAKQIHLDKMLAKRVQEEQELSEQQLKRKVEVQKAAQFYTKKIGHQLGKTEANYSGTQEVFRRQYK
ncbi:hypothetical protein Tco_0711687 [Tanacetum coccineum]